MEIHYGKGGTIYGPGVQIDLTGNEVAMAIHSYLVAHGVHIDGPRTVKINGELCCDGYVYVDPSGSVYHDGLRYSGRGPENKS